MTSIHTIISDNNNENSSDPNPYAYPYFKSNAEIPKLYKAVNSFASTLTKLQTQESTPTPTSTSSQLKALGNKLRLLEIITRKIISRCKSHPEESGWVDSCGENSLFRLCQLARFHNTSTNNNPIPIRTRARSEGEENGHEHEQEQQHEQLILRMHLRRCDDLLLVVQKSLMDAEPRAAYTVNNWNETPLHEFLKHCGFEQTSTSFESQDRSNSDTAIVETQLESESESEPKDSHAMPSVAFLDGLLHSCPLSILTPNYEKGLPIHEACTVSLLGDQQNTIPYASLSMEILFKSIMKSSLTTSTSTRRSGSYHNHQIQVEERNILHLQIIQNMIELHSKGLLVLDSKSRSPLYRAVESLNCHSNIVVAVLRKMELLFSGETHSLHTPDKNDVKILIRRAIFGLHIQTNTDDQVANRKGCKTILSPLKDLWQVFLHPRRVTASNYLKDIFQVDDVDLEKIMRDEETITLSELILACIVPDDQNSRTNILKDQLLSKHFVQQIGDLWTKVLVLMCAAFHGSVEYLMDKEQSEWYPIHAAISCKAPLCVLNLTIQLFPNDLKKKNSMGRTPLVQALSTLKPNTEFIRALALADENAVSIPDRRGLLPLHLALNRNIRWSGGLGNIFSAYPGAASARNPSTNAFPFVDAAGQSALPECPSSESEAGQTSFENEWLTTVYVLLRADPSVVYKNV